MFEDSTSSALLSVNESTTSISPNSTQCFDSVQSFDDVDATQPRFSTQEKPILVAGGRSVLAFFFTLFAAICLNAAPWLMEQGLLGVFFGWLGVTLAMFLSTQRGFVSRFVVTWIWCSCSVGMAFHWSPAALAYTLSSGLALGVAVAMPLILWDGLRLALGYWIAARITKDVRFHWLAAAVSAISLEYLMRGVFPWSIGCIQLPIPWTIQAVDIFGPSYATFVVFAIVGAVQLAVVETRLWWNCKRHLGTTRIALNAKTPWKRILVSPAFLALSLNFAYSGFAWQYWQSVSEHAPKIRVGLIQVDPSYKDSIEKTQKLTASVGDQVDLVCWPESSGGNYELQLVDLSDEDRVFQMSRNPMRGLRPWPNPKCEVLFAGKNFVGNPFKPDELFVTAMLVDRREHITGRYNKRFLMPFGEYVPGKDFVPGLSALFDMDEQINPGTTCCSLDSTTGARIGTLVCYEDMVPRAAREAVAEHANLLVALINGSAFDSRFTLYQHRLLAQMRALETRRYFLRCASTGETCVINPLGVIESRLPLQTAGVLVSEVTLIDGRTFYSHFPWLLPILGMGMILLVWNNARRKKELAI